MNYSLNIITKENWREAIKHVIKEEKKMWDLDNLMKETVEPLIISVDSTDESFEFSDSEDTFLDL